VAVIARCSYDFFLALRDHTGKAAARLSQIDYDRELTLIALEGDALVGIARMTAEPGFEGRNALS
jgi:hypothetical protein